jgi:hypothetical protein
VFANNSYIQLSVPFKKMFIRFLIARFHVPVNMTETLMGL